MPGHSSVPLASVCAAPFLKWAGGKGDLLPQYDPLFPTGRAGTAYEPFVGSGAVFFHLRGRDFAQRYCLSDVNAELINAYVVVRDCVNDLIERLEEHARRHNREHFAAVRGLDREPGWPDAFDPVARAARLIYLNRTCYNGLWRVNRQGHFNVPMGRYRNPTILHAHLLRAASAALQGVEVRVCRFDEAVREAGSGDFVYFDPPYVPLNATSNFTSYDANGFGVEEQQALAETFRALDARGCRVMLSNSDHPLVHALYAGFSIERVQARRRINSRAERRGAISELVVRNYSEAMPT